LSGGLAGQLLIAGLLDVNDSASIFKVPVPAQLTVVPPPCCCVKLAVIVALLDSVTVVVALFALANVAEPVVVQFVKV
jgi:hypothetical protein